MSYEISFHNHVEWKKYGLDEFMNFAECITEYNQKFIGDTIKGQWYYIPPNPVETPDGPHRVIYLGSFGEYNSPGASGYTSAHIYDMSDKADMKEFHENIYTLEGYPEWID